MNSEINADQLWSQAKEIESLINLLSFLEKLSPCEKGNILKAQIDAILNVSYPRVLNQEVQDTCNLDVIINEEIQRLKSSLDDCREDNRMLLSEIVRTREVVKDYNQLHITSPNVKI